MAAVVLLLVLLLVPRILSGPSAGPDPVSDRGRTELQRVRNLAAHPGYGDCWSRALQHLDTRCRDMTSDSQSRVALMFTYCHLSR